MIGPWDIISNVWALGVAYHAPRILDRWSLITTCDPIELCDACRDERKEVMIDADRYQVMGTFGSVLMVMLQAMAWHFILLVHAINKARGKKVPRCAKGTCVAHTGGKATA